MGIEEWGIKKYIPQRSRTALKRFLYAARAPLYRGTRYQCPICRGRFRKFLSFGRTPRNVQCPRCGSLERHRLVWLWLRDQTEFFEQEGNVLHIGPELALERELRPMNNVHYVSFDLHRSVMVRGDIRRMPFRDGVFDTVVCLHVLEHIDDDLAAMREIRRVLRPGGFAILQVPIHRELATTYEDWTLVTSAARLAAFEQEDHVRLYGRDYTDRLRTAGFRVKIDDYVKHLPPEIIARNVLDSTEDLYVGYSN